MNNNDWDETCDPEAWIGCRQDQATNTNTEFWMEYEYFHHVCIAATIYRCRLKCNHFIKLPHRTKSYLTKKYALWENQVKIHKITRTVVTEYNSTNKSEEVSEYIGFYESGNKYDLTFKRIRYKYKGKFKAMFEEITTGTPGVSVNIYYMNVQPLQFIRIYMVTMKFLKIQMIEIIQL